MLDGRQRLRPVPRPAIPRVMCLTAVLAVIGGFAWPSVGRALDDGPWERVLRAHGHRGGIDYAGLRADPAARADLSAFVAAIGTMAETADLADWLNAYNALVVSAVVERYPIDSVRSVPGFFDRIQHRVAGRNRTLDAVENRIIRPRFHDARVHFALNCGARSCPALPSRPFRAADLDTTLDRLTHEAVTNRLHVRARGGRLALSELFFWFEADFVRDAGSVRGFLLRHGVAVPVAGAQGEPTRMPYDWRLNQVAP